MNKKGAYRVVGLLVIIVLIIVLLPLLFVKNDFSVQKVTNITAPPIPGQPASLVANVENVPEQKNLHESFATSNENAVSTLASPGASGVTETNNTLSPRTNNEIAHPQDSNQQSAIEEEWDIVKPTETNANSVMKKIQPANINKTSHNNTEQAIQPIMAENVNSDVEKTKSYVDENQNLSIITSKRAQVTIHVTDDSKKTKLSKYPQTKLSAISSSPMWVIQMGSFNKNNAIHLKKMLEIAGYKTFIREINSDKKKAVYIQVYVGPLPTHFKALQVSNQIHRTMSMPTTILKQS